MITGEWYTGAELDLVLESEIDLTGADSVGIRATFADGSTVDYAGTVSNFSSVAAVIPAAGNIVPGLLTIRIYVIFPLTGKKFGDPDTLYLLLTPTVTP